MKTKPFNLEEAKAGAKLVTRDGRSARFIAHAPDLAYYFRVICSVDGNGYSTNYGEDGMTWKEEEISDLIIVVDPVVKWVNMYKLGSDGFLCAPSVFDSHADAVAGNDSGMPYIGALPIELP